MATAEAAMKKRGSIRAIVTSQRAKVFRKYAKDFKAKLRQFDCRRKLVEIHFFLTVQKFTRKTSKGKMERTKKPVNPRDIDSIEYPMPAEIYNKLTCCDPGDAWEHVR